MLNFSILPFSKIVDRTAMKDCSVDIPRARSAAELNNIWMAGVNSVTRM
jgi:hypothetical protein